MRVYQSISKSVLPAVHHPLKVPAALLSGGTTGTPGSGVLLETGDSLLLETGDFILLES